MAQKRQKGLAAKMSKITEEINKTKNETAEDIRIKAQAKAKKNGKKWGNEKIKKLHALIKTAARKGESSVSEWCYSDDEAGRWGLTTISQWAETEGFKTEYSRNCEGANEGQDNMDYLTISWK